MRNWFRSVQLMAAGAAAVVSLAVIPAVLQGQAPAAGERLRRPRAFRARPTASRT